MRGVTCLNCAAECPPENSYCGKCGEPLPVVCLECDAESHWLSIDCQSCGASILLQKAKNYSLFNSREDIL